VERADELVAPDYVDHAALPGQAPGLAGAKRKWAMYLAGIPDLRVTIEELVAEGDKVAVRRSYAGTHRGELLGIPATGKQVRLGGISIFRLARGKIAEQWEQLDRLALMQQLGVLPTPGQQTPQAQPGAVSDAP
jgi:predicted ester cyclase